MAGHFQSREANEIQWAHERLNLAPVSNPSRDNFFVIRKSGRRGLGCFAQRNIRRGTRIHIEKALFSIRDVENEELMGPATRERLQRELVRLRPNQYREYLDLTFANAEDAEGDRFQLNNFQMTQNDDGTSQQGVFVEAARFNHSCLPNAWVNWNPLLGNERRPQGRLTVYATRDIARDEEILINYQHEYNYHTKNERRRNLRSRYYFQCNCPACGNSARSRRGEQNRALMRLAQATIENNQGNKIGQRRALESNLVQLINLIDQEDLVYPEKANLLGDLAELYNRECGLRNSLVPNADQCWDAFLEAARGRLDAEILCLGENSVEVMDTLAWMADLE